jgi:hypothetical protein
VLRLDVQVFGCFGNGMLWKFRNDGQRWVREFHDTPPFPKQRYTGSLHLKYIRITTVFFGCLIIFVSLARHTIRRQTGEVNLYDTRGFQDCQKWKRVEGKNYTFMNPEHIVFENSYFRVTYPILREDQQAGHSYFVKVRDEWMRITSSEYGDYTYFVDSILKPPENITIVKNTSEEVTLVFTYNHKNYRADTVLKWAYHGDITLTKTMSLKKGYPGVFVKLQSIPVNPFGEREIGFGVNSPLVFSEGIIAQHPAVIYHVDLEMEKAHRHYAVSLPLSNSFYRLLVLSRAMKTYSYQFEPLGGGKLVVNQLIESDRDTYQAFLGAVPFDSSHSLVEAETLQNIETAIGGHERASGGKFLKMKGSEVHQSLVPLNIPSPGSYRLALRFRNKADVARLSVQIDQQTQMSFQVPKSNGFEYCIISDQYHFSSGEHTLVIQLESGELELDCVVVLPVLNRQDFPLDIVHQVLPEMLLIPSRFEGESLHRRTGRNVHDNTASNGTARFADDQNDKPDFLVFGPYQRVALSGNYVARFYVKFENNTIDDQLAILDIFSDKTGVLAHKVLTGKDFKKTTTYQPFELDFTIQPTYPQEVYKLEFRVYFTGNADLWVDYIELISEKRS